MPTNTWCAILRPNRVNPKGSFTRLPKSRALWLRLSESAQIVRPVPVFTTRLVARVRCCSKLLRKPTTKSAYTVKKKMWRPHPLPGWIWFCITTKPPKSIPGIPYPIRLSVMKEVGLRPSILPLPIRLFPAKTGQAVSRRPMILLSDSVTVSRLKKTAITPFCCIYSKAWNQAAKARLFFRTVCCFAAMPKRVSVPNCSTLALLKALLGCLPTCFTAQAFRRALSSLIKNMPKLPSLPKMARGKSLVVVACLWLMHRRALSKTATKTVYANKTFIKSSTLSQNRKKSPITAVWCI